MTPPPAEREAVEAIRRRHEAAAAGYEVLRFAAFEGNREAQQSVQMYDDIDTLLALLPAPDRERRGEGDGQWERAFEKWFASTNPRPGITSVAATEAFEAGYRAAPSGPGQATAGESAVREALPELLDAINAMPKWRWDGRYVCIGCGLLKSMSHGDNCPVKRVLDAQATVEAALAAPAEAETAPYWREHVPCTNEQHDPANGLLAGFCVRCRQPWPCQWSPESRVAVPSRSEAERAVVEAVKVLSKWAVWRKGNGITLAHAIDGDGPTAPEWSEIGAALAALRAQPAPGETR